MSVRVSRSRTKLGQIALARLNVKKGDGRKLVFFAQISTCTSLNMLSMPNSISNICIFQQRKNTQNLIQKVTKTSTENVEPNKFVFVKPNVNA